MGGLLGLLGANVPALILLLVGVGLLVFEMYIPGFGVPGTLGIGSLVMGFVVLKPSMEQGLLLFVVLAAVLCVALSVCLVTASRGRLEKSRLALKDVALDPNAAASNDLNYFIGKTGVTESPKCAYYPRRRGIRFVLRNLDDCIEAALCGEVK